MKNKNTKFAFILLKKLTPYYDKDNISTEFQQLYEYILKTKGKVSAEFWLWTQILKSIPGFISAIIYWRLVMFKNYFKITLRNFYKHKGFFFINVSGFAAGMACCILIMLYVHHEYSYDKHHEKADNIYRVCMEFENNMTGAYTGPPLAEALVRDFPEVKNAVRLSVWPQTKLVSYRDKKFLEKRVIAADASVFDIFTIPFVKGNPQTALTQPNTIVITESIAKKYFGEKNPLNEQITIDDQNNLYRITGVIKDCPETSHIHYDFILSLISWDISRNNRWMNCTFFTYIELPENYDPAELEEKFPGFLKTNYGQQFFDDAGMTLDEYFAKDNNNRLGYRLQPLTDIYFAKELTHDLKSTHGNITYIYVFTIAAFLILVIACINFMNLSTARFSTRSKEVGLRKTLGSSRSNLVGQFLTESVMMSIFSLIIAVVIIQLVIPAFRNFSGIHLKLDYFGNIYTIPSLIGFSLISGFSAGLYPAFFLTRFHPVKTLRGLLDKSSKSHLFLRRALVFIQFSISIIVLTCAYIVFNQINFINKSELGFTKDNILIIHRSDVLGSQREAFKQELLKNPGIITVSKTSTLPGRHFNAQGHVFEGKSKEDGGTLYTIFADYDFAELYDLKIKKGNYFSKEMSAGSKPVLVNEAAVKAYNFKNPIGQRIKHSDEWGYFSVIGVIKDIHFKSLHTEVQPMAIYPLMGKWGDYTSIKIQNQNIKETTEYIKTLWDRFTNNEPFLYSFLDDDLKELYLADKKTGQVFSAFSVLAIIIACMGLYGLISFSVERRIKEIGIRKVLGAANSNIFYILSRDIILIVILSSMAAVPVVFYYMKSWLQNFAYRINISPFVFICTALLTLFIALITMSYQIFKAVRSNPADSLKYE